MVDEVFRRWSLRTLGLEVHADVAREDDVAGLADLRSRKP